MEFSRKKEVGRPLNSKSIGAALPVADVSAISLSKWHTTEQPSRCYTAIYQDKPIAFIAVVSFRMKAKYYRVSRSRFTRLSRNRGRKRLLNFIAELYTSQTKLPLLHSNKQSSDYSRKPLRIGRLRGLGMQAKEKTTHRINSEIRRSLSRKRITVSMQYVSSDERRLPPTS